MTKNAIDIDLLSKATGIHWTKLKRHLQGVTTLDYADKRCSIDMSYLAEDYLEKAEAVLTVKSLSVQLKGQSKAERIDTVLHLLRTAIHPADMSLLIDKATTLTIDTRDLMRVFLLIPEDEPALERKVIRNMAKYFSTAA